METKSILIVAHGSRESLANDEVMAMANQLAEQIGDAVEVAFLDPIAKPNIPEVVDKLIAAGATTITVLPFFLNTGKHVQKDIPAIITQKREEHPTVQIELKEHLGSRSHILEILKSMVNE